MPLPGFYDDNEGRYYPLVPFSNVPLTHTAPAIPPPSTLLDFGCMVGLDAEFDSDAHVVYLHRIVRDGGVFEFCFRSDAPGLEGRELVFRRALADAEYATDYAESAPADPDDYDQAPLWEGFLATGPMEDLAALMPDDGTVVAGTMPQVEPALVQNLGRSYLRTISLANQDRTKAMTVDGCPPPLGNTLADRGYIVNARGLVGDLRFKEGYNISISQSTRGNSITLAASRGAGAGLPCEEVPLYPGEVPPDGGSLLTGGPACDEVVSSINGLSASVIQLVADLGVTISPDPHEKNKLVVDVDRKDMTVCDAVEVIVEDLGDG